MLEDGAMTVRRAEVRRLFTLPAQKRTLRPRVEFPESGHPLTGPLSSGVRNR